MLHSVLGFQHNCGQRYGQKGAIPSIIYFACAGVAELADAVALGATGRKSLEVQILSPAPNQEIRRLIPPLGFDGYTLHPVAPPCHSAGE
jgi:hypothetical protein